MPWQFLLLIIAAVVIYVIADAFFDISRKIGGRFPSLAGIGAKFASLGFGGWMKLAAIPLALGAVWGAIEFVKHQGRLEERLEQAEVETETQVVVNGRDTDIAAIAQDVALMRQQLRQLAQRGRDEIAAAAPANEPPLDPGVVAAWRASLDRLCVARADGARADPCGPKMERAVP